MRIGAKSLGFYDIPKQKQGVILEETYLPKSRDLKHDFTHSVEQKAEDVVSGNAKKIDVDDSNLLDILA